MDMHCMGYEDVTGDLVETVLSQVRWGRSAHSVLGSKFPPNSPAARRVGSVITRRCVRVCVGVYVSV